MKNKQIVFTEPNVATLVENELSDELEENEVLVKMEYTAISSGTERANLIGEIHINGAKKMDKAVFPRALGYSGVGIIERVGERVKSIQPGDRVIVYFGKHKQYNVMPENQVYKINDESISSAEAALTVIAAFPLAGVRKTRVEIGESALVAGLGILGLIAVEIYKAAGAAPVIASDLNPERRRLALQLGADFALDPSAPDYVETVKKITFGKGVNAAVEVTGVSEALLQTLDCMAHFGRVALLGCTRNPDCNVDFYHQVHYPGVSIIGANNFARPKFDSSPGNWTSKDDCEALLKLIAGGRLDLKSLISEVYSPNEAPDVYSRLAFDNKNFPIGVLFDWAKLQ
jgi:2-desacetyl-2-hydroxyethyl bacteriochlorophyllide A dehydrogenase